MCLWRVEWSVCAIITAIARMLYTTYGICDTSQRTLEKKNRTEHNLQTRHKRNAHRKRYSSHFSHTTTSAKGNAPHILNQAGTTCTHHSEGAHLGSRHNRTDGDRTHSRRPLQNRSHMPHTTHSNCASRWHDSHARRDATCDNMGCDMV